MADLRGNGIPAGEMCDRGHMRKSLRATVLTVLAFVTAIALGIASALTGAVTLAATALIVPGTGTPNATNVTDYMQNARDRYIAPFNPFCSDDTCTLTSIQYPASFWPIPLPGWCVPGRCDKWDTSVGLGVADMQAKLAPFLGTDEDVVIFGYSQGGAVVSNTMRYLATLPPEDTDNFRVVMIGNIDNPVGGLWSLLGFLGHVPVLDVTTGLSTPVDTGIHFTNIGFQYDPVVGAPIFWGNALALANMLVAFDTVHGYYLTPNGNNMTASIAYGYTDAELATQLNCGLSPTNCRTDDFGNTYVTIPAKSLPLSDFVLGLASSIGLTPIVKPFVDLLTPLARVLIDTAYLPDANPGRARYLSLLPFNPFMNYVKFGIDVVQALVEGVQNMINGGPPATVTAGSAQTAGAAPPEAAARSAGQDPPKAKEPEAVVTGDDEKAGDKAAFEKAERPQVVTPEGNEPEEELNDPQGETADSEGPAAVADDPEQTVEPEDQTDPTTVANDDDGDDADQGGDGDQGPDGPDADQGGGAGQDPAADREAEPAAA